jgi:hypothetical protein
MALQHPAAQEGCKFITQTALRQFDPLWITLFSAWVWLSGKITDMR